MNPDTLLFAIAFIALIVASAMAVGLSLHRWWLSKGRPASQRIDADVRFLQSVPAGVEREVQR